MATPEIYVPAGPREVEAVIAAALADKSGLEVRAGGSKRLMRKPLSAPALLDLRAISGITNYDPDELVVTALAATPLHELEAVLAPRQQMLAFEPFDHGPLFGEPPGRATLGGIVAANVSGSRRLSSGAARDHLLGFTAVSGRGERLTGGGAVVKNVTGFDLPKLMAGSWGTLAVMVSLTLRVLPRPRAETSLLFRGLSDVAAVGLMNAAMALPAAVSAAAHVPAPHDDAAAAAAGSVTALRLEGFAPSVDARCRDLLRALGPTGSPNAVEGEESALFWRALSVLDALPRERHDLWRLSVPPALGWRVRPSLEALDPARAPALRYVYDWAGGLVFAAVPSEDSLAWSAHIRAAARGLGGHATLIRGAPELRDQLVDHRVSANAHAEVQRRVKAAFDPFGILNPGLDLSAGN